MARFDDTSVLGGKGPPKDPTPTLTSRVDEMMKAFEEVNTYYIEKIADQIKIIGEMNASSISRLRIMAQMNENIAEIKKRLRRAASITSAQLDKILQTAYEDYDQSPSLKRAMDETPLSEDAKERLDQLAKTISRQTQGTMQNLSNTSLSWQNYRRYVDQAILAVTSGLGSYTEMTRRTVRELGYNGLQVQYSSGYHRRMDSAIRANVISAANQLAQQGSDIVAEDLGMNAKELTAHKAPAPDHAPVQGRVLLNAEFEKMQSGEGFEDIDGHKYEGFKRPIGEWNCMHMAMGFDTRYSRRKYTDEELKKIQEDNEKGCIVNGKHYTTYEANQRMRQIETEIRRQKGVGVAAEKASDEQLREEAQKKIDRLGENYLEFSKESGLKPKWDRLEVNGFKRVDVLDPEAKTLLNDAHSRDIPLSKRAAQSIIDVKKRNGTKGVLTLKPERKNLSEYDFDSKHINTERSHEVSKAEAQSFVDNAVFKLSRWNDKSQNFYSKEGAAYLREDLKSVRTSFKADEFDAETAELLKEVLKHVH